MRIKRADTRGLSQFDRLESRHSFSFGGYYDPDWIQFGPLRVINDDRLAGGGGFPSHPHKDMEIISIVLSGKLAHKDSMGNGSVIEAGEVQYMSAGKGVVHSEMNPSPTEPVHFLQIWILPDKAGYTPTYAQIQPSLETGSWTEIVGPDEDALSIRQDATLRWGKSSPDQVLDLTVGDNRQAWIQVVEGTGSIGTTSLQSGDAVMLDPGEIITLQGNLNALWFDLPVEG